MAVLKLGSTGESVRQVQIALGIKADGCFGIETENAVKNFQQCHGLTVDGIVGNQTLALLMGHKAGNLYIKKSKRGIDEIIVHCTATPEGQPFTVNDIKQWHIARGFKDIGYHYVIYLDGSIHVGRDVDKSGAHTLDHNLRSIGISYVGGVAKDGKTPKDTRTDRQKSALLRLLGELRKLYPKARIYGHRDFANKACPSFDAKREYRFI